MRASIGGAALAVGLVALPAAASAAALTVDTPCVRENDPVKFHLAGFAADASVSLYDNSAYLSEATVGSGGDFSGQFNPGGLGDTAYAAHTLAASDPAGNSASATYAIAKLGVVGKPVSTKPAAKVSYYAQGFVEGGTLYAHYAYSKSDTVKVFKKTVSLGKLTGPCGTITTKKVTQLPIKKAKKGVYEIQFDTNPSYKRQQGIYVESSFFLAKTQKQ